MMKKLGLVIFTLVALIFSANAQGGNEWNYGENKPLTQGKYNMMKIYMESDSSNSLKLASSPFVWLLNNAPKLHKNLYLRGHVIYQNRVKAEKDPAQKNILEDSALIIYDLRIKAFGDEANVLNEKGRVAYKYWYDRKEKTDELYELYLNIYLNNKLTIFPRCAEAFMNLSVFKLQTKKLTEDQFRGIYEGLTTALSKQIAQEQSEKKKKRIQKYYDKIGRTYTGYAQLSCEIIENIFGKKYDSVPDLQNAKRLYGLLSNKKYKCFSSKYLIPTLITIASNEPNAGTNIAIGKLLVGNQLKDSAMTFFNKAYTLSNDKEQKAELDYEIAKILSSKVSYSSARERALKCIGTSYTSKAYSLIGQMYKSSYTTCKSDNPVKSRAVYILAYEMFKKAGNSTEMNVCQKQFPDAEDIFERNYKEGESITIDCWIQKTVLLKARP